MTGNLNCVHRQAIEISLTAGDSSPLGRSYAEVSPIPTGRCPIGRKRRLNPGDRVMLSGYWWFWQYKMYFTTNAKGTRFKDWYPDKVAGKRQLGLLLFPGDPGALSLAVTDDDRPLRLSNDASQHSPTSSTPHKQRLILCSKHSKQHAATNVFIFQEYPPVALYLVTCSYTSSQYSQSTQNHHGRGVLKMLVWTTKRTLLHRHQPIA
jgi:hypothetical protein